MERHAPYPPSTPKENPSSHRDHKPPSGFVDYWDWDNQDNPIGVKNGRLALWLREAARTRNPLEILRRAVVAMFHPITDNPAAESQALADLSVTGRAAYSAFAAAPPQDNTLFQFVQPSLVGIAEKQIRNAVRTVLDRAYTVAWALRSSPAQRQFLREPLQWIALSSEDDPPHAPTNVPATQHHMGELTMRIGQSGQQVTLRATLMLSTEPATEPPSKIARRSLPAPTAFADILRNRAAGGYDELFLFVHGLGSSAEESETFKKHLITIGAERGRRYAVLSVDMPGMGYSSRIDIDELIARRSHRNRHHGFALPNGVGSNFPLLGLYRDTLVEICNTTAGGVQYVMGGSLGGNMTLWLAAEPMFTDLIPERAGPSSVLRFLSWSPASIWESYERANLPPFPPLLQIVTDLFPNILPNIHPSPQQILIEVLLKINSKTDPLEPLIKSLKLKPLILALPEEIIVASLGLALLDPTFIGTFIGTLTTTLLVILPQILPQLIDQIGDNSTYIDIGKNGARERARERMHEDENGSCKKFFDLMQQGETLLDLHILRGGWGYTPTKNNLLLQSELYGEQYRRVFWAAGYEQVTFSHQEPLSPSGQWPFNTIRKPLFLASGTDDVGAIGVADIYNNVVKVSDACPDVPGLRLLMQETKHSISDERPKHLAEQIVNFLPPKKQSDVSFLTTLLLSEPDKRTDISFLTTLLAGYPCISYDD